MKNDLAEELEKSWGADGTRIIAPQAGDFDERANRHFSLLISHSTVISL
jgi:hypothetical protein